MSWLAQIIENRPGENWRRLSTVALVAWLVFFLGFLWYAARTEDDFLFLDRLNLVVHEAGHPLFSFFGETMNILWQLGPYILLTTAEVLVSTTGLEFAYSQAPPEMKGTLMASWNLTTAIGNLVVARASSVLTLTGASLFFAYAGVAFLAGIALAFIARSYRPVDYFRAA